jgi:hypothetical protein
MPRIESISGDVNPSLRRIQCADLRDKMFAFACHLNRVSEVKGETKPVRSALQLTAGNYAQGP